MQVAFDPAKDAANLAKHGASLSFGSRIFDDPDHLLIETFRPVDGEFRRKVVGIVDDRLWTAIHVVRGDVTRFISVRRSNDGECRGYDRDPGRS